MKWEELKTELPRARCLEAAGEGKKPSLGVGWAELPLRPAPRSPVGAAVVQQTDVHRLQAAAGGKGAFPEVFLTWPRESLAPECSTL